MIEYSAHGTWVLQKLFRMNGSVFPSAFIVAFPCAAFAAVVKVLIEETDVLSFLKSEDSILKETQAWSGFSFLVGFLIVFRTSQAYNRFWDGCTATHQMRAEWFDGCSALISFAEHARAKVDDKMLDDFRGRIVRLFSMLHACALAELESINAGTERIDEVSAFKFDVLDPGGFDTKSLSTIKYSDSKVELVYSWIQTVIVESMLSGVLSIPPPILSRAFQEIANGMVAFHDAVKITYIPFPFPYAQTCDCLLVMHWLVTPLVIPQWVSHPAWAAVFVFIQVFILWALNFIATEIENPFGTDPNDIDGGNMQKDMNRHLLLLLRQEVLTTPKLQTAASSCEDAELGHFLMESFHSVWQNKETDECEGSQSIRGPREFYQFTRAKVAPQNHGFKRRGSAASGVGEKRDTVRRASSMLRMLGHKQSSMSLESGLSSTVTNSQARPPPSPAPSIPIVSPISAAGGVDSAKDQDALPDQPSWSRGLPGAAPSAPPGQIQAVNSGGSSNLPRSQTSSLPLPPHVVVSNHPDGTSSLDNWRRPDSGPPLPSIVERNSERPSHIDMQTSSQLPSG
eukprot:CAMPEP_0178390812 /NCGR_PEP_ID=MMETSP0689_2-20121128/10839_1 /TAXON_ID=160604 /ORGANISM="Amphidinium massartii, Strain CS-259" /LENGTH=567 /DNA_ID=CAMNT_0020011333 /DNA_START=34 /DNA_END=1737 /DNA_ORIENTATION=+